MNEHEFTRIVMVYSSKFYGYSCKILGNQEEAQDVVQDLYIKLWSMRNNLTNINNIEAFATTIIRNLCIDRLKRIKRGILHSEHYGKQINHYEFNAFESSLNNEEFKLELIRDAIKRLPDIQKKVFIMRDFEEKEFDFISLELGLTSENVRVILSRARMKIRELIKKSNK